MIVVGYVASVIDAVAIDVRVCDTSISMESTARTVDVRIVFVVLEIILPKYAELVKFFLLSFIFFFFLSCLGKNTNNGVTSPHKKQKNKKTHCRIEL